MSSSSKKRLGFCASTVANLFFLINIGVLACGALFGSFALYFFLQSQEPLSLGSEDLKAIFAVTGGYLFLVGIIGMMAVAEESRWITKFYSMIIIVAMVLQSVVGVFLMVSSHESRVEHGWKSLSDHHRMTLERRLGCCGLYSVRESPRCTSSRGTPCAELILRSQRPVITLLYTLCLGLAGVDVICLMIANFLYRKYKKLNGKSSQMPSDVASMGYRPEIRQSSGKHEFPESFRKQSTVSGNEICFDAPISPSKPQSLRHASMKPK